MTHSTTVSARTWDRLLFSRNEFPLGPEEVHRLPWVASKVATVSFVGSSVEVRLGPYAGTLFVTPDFAIDVQELVKGTVAACLSLSRTGRRHAPQRAAGAQRVEPTVAIAQLFVDLCSDFVRRGALKGYVGRHEAVPKPRGRIDILGTLRGPMARGSLERVVCRWRQLTEDTALNRVLLSAAVRAERIFRDYGNNNPEARLLVIALSGAKFFPSPDVRIQTSSPDVAEIVGLASTLIGGVPLALSPGVGDEPVSAWINVERVFEEAVYELCGRKAGHQRVSRGSDNGIKLFHAGPSEPSASPKVAEPDVVIDCDGPTPMVLDAKYRRSGENPADEELYQLIAHAVAYRATAAALVTPARHGPPAIRRLGRIVTGCSVDVISVDASSAASLESSVDQWLSNQASMCD
jgi:hypothetical protein